MKHIFATTLYVLSAGNLFVDDFLFKTLDFPGAAHSFASAIDNGIIVGTYSNSISEYTRHGFVYEGNSYSTLDFPGSTRTALTDISGNRIVGFYFDQSGLRHGFLYEAGIFTTLDPPLTSSNPNRNGSEALGISGDRIVGGYMDDSGSTYSYVYDGTNFATLNYPGSGFTTATGVDGNNIVGSYGVVGRRPGYVYDGVTFRTIDHPSGVNGTVPLDIFGDNVVGYFANSSADVQGFLFDGNTFTTVAVPPMLGTQAIPNGIEGRILVGQYIDKSGRFHGFVTIPEPSALALCMSAVFCCLHRYAIRRTNSMVVGKRKGVSHAKAQRRKGFCDYSSLRLSALA
jgi:hypothetical protein